MRKIQLNAGAFMASPNEKKFILLGSEAIEDSEYLESQIKPKINKKKPEQIPGFWGTLGFMNDDKIDWSGHIEISTEGNDNFKGVIKEEIELIKDCFPQLEQDSGSIKEKFISFEHIDFNFPEVFSLEDIPMLRLDLMLRSDEGAVVLYQSDKEDIDDGVIEYIQPQATDGHNINDRDRLKYFFDVIPQFQLEEVENTPGLFRLGTTKEHAPFIVKIITFKRNFEELSRTFSESFERIDSKELIEQVQAELHGRKLINNIAKDHRLLVYNLDKNGFDEAKHGMIDTRKKTLFLMHGTFGSTEASFGKLYGNQGTWLKSLTNAQTPTGYEQVLAFDHPTLFYGAEENISVLFEKLNALNIGSFSEEVDLIGTSQGGLLVQFLANMDTDRIKVGKCVLVASANGVGYLTVGKYVSKFLTALKYVFKYTGMQAQSLVSALAQHSVDWLLKQPGFEVMTPGHEKLTSIINVPPKRIETVYLPIIDDYDESLISKDQPRVRRFFKRMGAGLLDRITKKMLGTENDWVVGTRNQFIIPADYCIIPGYNPAKYRDEIIKAIHGTCINKPEAQHKIESFFFGPAWQALPETNNVDYFDAHCHIFGREVISGRIIYLLLQELLSYRKASDTGNALPAIPNLTAEMSDDAEGETGSVARNIIKYFALNKDSFQMLNDLEDEYYKLNSNVYRYIPLMFDLEMTFRNKYYEHDINDGIALIDTEFKKQIKAYIKDIDKYIDKFEKLNEKVFDGSQVENEEGIKVLKIIKMTLKALKVADVALNKDTVSGYNKQLNELKGLKVRYGKSIFPMIAVDPRRKDMSQLITENVGPGKTFHGIKIYAPNGYSPGDPNLCDNSVGFIDGKSLYQYCIENNLPIMAHCSNAGFSTFTKELEVYGDVLIDDTIQHYNTPTKVTFKHTIFDGGFAEAVRERAIVLNHPKLWRKVLEQYPDLTICLAHFGGESQEWRDEIAQLMRDFPNVYTDLSCMVKKSRLISIKQEFFDANDPIVDKIMYGSDYFLSMLNKITFRSYYKHFTAADVFSDKQMKVMSVDVPKRFLGIGTQLEH